VEQNTEIQYDDDLTIGTEEYDDSYYTGAEDLFELSADEKSPISRLKSLVLSIDWEITDEVLLKFNDELAELRGYWAGERINLVYVQALEKISKYIYIKKADSHPSAIKLLLTMYQNLEKIVSSEDWSEEKKKEILFEDVRRFDLLKAHIKKDAMGETAPVEEEGGVAKEGQIGGVNDLINLKAIVLGIDWEITDEDLNNLRTEVLALEKRFADSKPRLIFLQGIGTLGAYIKHKKSNAHAEAFKVLHLFYESLEKIVSSSLSLEEEKSILFPAVEKFNDFKALLGSTISADVISREKEETLEDDDEQSSAEIVPAFSDIPEDEIHGFQADDEAQALGYSDPDEVVSHVAGFFSDDGITEGMEPGQAEQQKDELSIDDAPATILADTPIAEDLTPALMDTLESTAAVEAEVPTAALSGSLADDADVEIQGVDVETEADDDSEEDALLEIDGQLAPALAISGEDEEGGFNEDRAAAELDEEIAGVVFDFFGEDDGAEAPVVDPDTVSAVEVEDDDAPVVPALFDVGEEPGLEEAPNVNRELALQGVDVERDADDDSDEEPLPFTGQDPAPAFAAEDPEISAEDFTQALEEAGADSEDIAARLDQFFGEEPPAQDIPAEVAPVIIAESQESEVVFELVDDSVDMLVSFHARVRELVAKPVESIPQHFFEELETLKEAFQKNSSEKELLGIIATLLSMRKDN